MEPKPTVEQFIYDCFRQRTETLKKVLEIRRDYRQRFYHSECLWDSRRGVVEDSEGGKIVDVSPSGIGTDVITTGSCTYCARYGVRPSGQNWLIHGVEIKCGRCQAKGADTMCVMCEGTGWQSCKVLPRSASPNRGEQHFDQSTSATTDIELGRRMPCVPDIKQFMTDHFRERIAVLKKEVEIHAAYREGFYSPECNWDAKEITGQWMGEAENIMSVTRTGPVLYVVTHGYTPFRLRYHLRPERQTWLIWEVDTECPLCYRQGRRADCFWCGGTIWEHK